MLGCSDSSFFIELMGQDKTVIRKPILIELTGALVEEANIDLYFFYCTSGPLFVAASTFMRCFFNASQLGNYGTMIINSSSTNGAG